MKPRIIAVEGIDGSGKETLAKSLTQALQNEGLSVELVSFPRYDHPVIMTAKSQGLLTLPDASSSVEEMVAAVRTNATWFSLDRMSWVNSVLPTMDCDVVVVDRFKLSNVVYQVALLRTLGITDQRVLHQTYEAILGTEFPVVPNPDITLFLATTYEEVHARRMAAGVTSDDLDDAYERSANLQWNCYAEYLRIAQVRYESTAGLVRMVPSGTREETLRTAFGLAMKAIA